MKKRLKKKLSHTSKLFNIQSGFRCSADGYFLQNVFIRERDMNCVILKDDNDFIEGYDIYLPYNINAYLIVIDYDYTYSFDMNVFYIQNGKMDSIDKISLLHGIDGERLKENEQLLHNFYEGWYNKITKTHSYEV